jgi:hypothetical protein
MRRNQVGPMRLLALLTALLAVATLALAQGVELRTPHNGQVIRGIVPLSATKPNPGEGWVSYMLTGGQLGKPTLIAAVIDPFTYDWNTRERQEGKQVFPDGQYTLVTSAHDPTSRIIGSEKVSVTIQNTVTGPDAANGVRLEYEFPNGASDSYTVTGDAELTLTSGDQAYEAAVAPLAGVMDLTFTRTILGYSQQDGGIVRNAPLDGVLEMEGVAPRLFPDLGKLFTIYQATNGVTKAMRKDDPRFGLGELYVALPSRTLHLGDTWESEMAFLPEFTKAKRQIVNGTHTLEGLEWMHGRKCARVKSTYSYKGSLTMRPGAYDVDLETDMKGTQTMWFAYETGELMHLEEENKHSLTIDTSKLGGASMAGAGMMSGMGMGMPGMGMPGMGMPGMGMSGMMGGGPGMMGPGSMMPGARMPGMMMPGAAGGGMPMTGGMAPPGEGAAFAGMGSSAGPMVPGMMGTAGGMSSGMGAGGMYGTAKQEIEAEYRVHVILDTGRLAGEIVAEASRRPRVHIAPAEPGAAGESTGARPAAAAAGGAAGPRVAIPRR